MEVGGKGVEGKGGGGEVVVGRFVQREITATYSHDDVFGGEYDPND